MFTGIIEGTGRVKSLQKREGDISIEVVSDFNLEQTNVGDSISVNGCCLTITSRLGNTFWADLSEETLTRTTFQFLEVGAIVNLERPLKFGERLGGHFVQGHIDGIGEVIDILEVGNEKKIKLRCPVKMIHYLVEKGSVAVDGVSLTVNECFKDSFSVIIIPHTQTVTTFQRLERGSKVNLEVDILGKYVEKLTHLDSEAYAEHSALTVQFLKKHGFQS